MEYKKSKIDNLFYDIMGYYPSKEGMAYELISAAVLGLILNQSAQHNQYVIGTSGCKYQLDGIIDGNTMLEAKDYSKSGEKVGRSDLQKLEGAMIDLKQIDKGIFSSATQYTSEASKYANGTKQNSAMKEIIPLEIRPSATEDERNRIKTVICHIHSAFPDYERGKFDVVFSDGEHDRLMSYLEKQKLGSINVHLELFYNDNGQQIATLYDLTRKHKVKIDDDIDEIDGVIDINAYVNIGPNIYKIKGLKYSNVPIVRLNHSFTITKDGTPKIFVKSEDLNIDKLITEEEIKQSISNILNAQY